MIRMVDAIIINGSHVLRNPEKLLREKSFKILLIEKINKTKQKKRADDLLDK